MYESYEQGFAVQRERESERERERACEHERGAGGQRKGGHRSGVYICLSLFHCLSFFLPCAAIL